MRPRLFAALGWYLAAGTVVAAGCTREITAPVSVSGASVIVEDGNVHGVYPDLLRALAPRTGCRFAFPVVPRARQVALFESGMADLLMPATRTVSRDMMGTFVPMIRHRAMLISVDRGGAPITSARQLLARRELRVAVVRGFDYGFEYAAMVDELRRQGRLFREVDVVGVARLLHAGSADVTIMGPTLMAAAIRRDARVQGLQDKLKFQPIPELPWQQSGAYISHALKAEDQALLREALEKLGSSNQVLEGYQHYFRADMLSDSVRAR
ncbi:transporter substrate-binding domain-containing protein [Duganella callida]|uniref:Transporter substrate-binding domain-containing protein n=2 Tax=Duganella callida TaxID=2561932 RepID=A0A4Y9S1P1_9BURK|nr:transporter substrate-binding domain-containing protein [Duganella callida]